MNKNPLDIVKYILIKCAYCGDLITNLKMQKILYYVYVWCRVQLKQSCFEEKFQAWPNGPVLPSVYDALKSYGASPIDVDFAGIDSEEGIIKLKKTLGKELVELVDSVYEKYGTMSAFTLVSLTHSELPWKNARKGLEVGQRSINEISDKDILAQYVEKK